MLQKDEKDFSDKLFYNVSNLKYILFIIIE